MVSTMISPGLFVYTEIVEAWSRILNILLDKLAVLRTRGGGCDRLHDHVTTARAFQYNGRGTVQSVAVAAHLGCNFI